MGFRKKVGRLFREDDGGLIVGESAKVGYSFLHGVQGAGAETN